MCHFRAQNTLFVLYKIFCYKPLLLLRACTLLQLEVMGGGGRISQKPLLGGGESDLFILEGEVILLGGGVILLGESRNFEVKIKIA